MGKQQVNTGKGYQTVNTNNVWERIVALENNGVPNLSEELNGVKSQLAQNVKQDYSKIRSTRVNPRIVCYGDSNTRFYEGDKPGNGSISFAYSTVIDKECFKYPELFNSVVINAGYPGETIQYGLTNYTTNVTNNNPDIVVIGFGTNNIKLSSETMDTYLTNMETMIERLRNDGIEPLVLGIPFFDANYAGADMQARIPVWNDALFKLCRKYNVEFVNTYEMFPESEKAYWFNEATSKRHYSKFATQVLGKELVERIKKIIGVYSTAGFIRESFPNQFVNETFYEILNPTALDMQTYKFDTIDNINTLYMPTGTDMKFKAGGNFCLAFYPRSSATLQIIVDGVTNTFTINNTIDVGLYYPMRRFSAGTILDNPSEYSIVQVKVISGSAYLRGISSKYVPTLQKYNVTNAVPYNASSLPASPSVGQRVFVNELMKEVIYMSNYWVDGSGYVCVGNTSLRTTNQANLPVGFKYYDTDTSLKYRWNGTSWATF